MKILGMFRLNLTPTIAVTLILTILSGLSNCEEAQPDDKLFISKSYNVFARDRLIINGPRCIPLVSKHINSNPYHELLLSKPGSNVRKGYRIHRLLNHEPIQCSHSYSQPFCSINYEKSYSIEYSDSYSFSHTKTDSLSASLGQQITQSMSLSISKSIEESNDTSGTFGLTKTNDAQVSKSLGESLQKTHEDATSETKSKTFDQQETNAITQDTNIGDTISTEVSVSKSESLQVSSSTSRGGTKSTEVTDERTTYLKTNLCISAGFSSGKKKDSNNKESNNKDSNNKDSNKKNFDANLNAGFDHSHTESHTQSNRDENNWNNQMSESSSSTKENRESLSQSKQVTLSNGKSNARTSSYGGSSTEENRQSDTISNSREVSNVKTISNSTQDSNTQAISVGYRVNDADTTTNGNGTVITLNNDTSSTQSHGKENIISLRISNTTTIRRNFEINRGETYVLGCQIRVTAVAVPYECIQDDGSKILAYLDYMIVDKDELNSSKTCNMVAVSEEQISTFMINDNNLNMKNDNNFLMYGQLKFDKNFQITSSNSRFSLKFEGSNLIFYDQDLPIWQNYINFDVQTSPVRLRITEKGHLIQEAQNIFENVTSNDEWVTVWSSVPINLNVTIGIPRIPGKPIAYKLILTDEGTLNLYDAVGAIIWHVNPNYQLNLKHYKGYKYPEVYLMPTKFITPPDPTDNHNRINGRVSYKPNGTIYSLDDNCQHGLMSNEGIRSANGRFKLIVENSGNMLIKDEQRTMWETSTANFSGHRGPYKVILTPRCNLMLLDVDRRIIWTSGRGASSQVKRPCKATLVDEGRLEVTDADNQLIWHTWPISVRDVSSTLNPTYFTRVVYNFRPCHDFSSNSLTNVRNLKWNENYEYSKKRKKISLIVDTRDQFDFTFGSFEFKLKVKNKSTSYSMYLSDYENSSKRIYIAKDRSDTEWYSHKLVWTPERLAHIEKQDKPSFGGDTNVRKLCDPNQIPQRRMYLVIKVSYSETKDKKLKNLDELFQVDYFRTRSWNGTNRQINTFWPNNQLTKVKLIADDNSISMKANNSLECRQKCLNTNICTAVTYDTNSFQCNLYQESSTRLSGVKMRNAVSYVDTCERAPFSYMNIRIKGSPFKRLSAVDEYECWQLCIQTKNCLAVSFTESACEAFNISLVQFYRAVGWNSYTVLELNTTRQYKKSDVRLYNHFEQLSNVKNLNECWNECTKKPNCSAVTFAHNSNNRLCQLFDYQFTFRNEIGWTSLILFDVQTTFKFSESQNVLLIPDQKQQPLRAQNAQQCMDACLQTENCPGYSHNNVTNLCMAVGRGNYTYKRAPSWTSYTIDILDIYKVQTAQNLKLIDDFRNVLLSDNTANLGQACWRECLNHARCTAVTLNGRRCHLFDQTENFQKSIGFVTYSLHNIDTKTFKYYPKVKLYRSFTSVNVYSKEQCLHQCQAFDNCTAFSVSLKTTTRLECHLHASDFEFEKAADWDSYSISSLDVRSFKEYANIRLYKGRVLFGKNLAHCRNYCNEDKACTAFSHSKVENACWLFDNGYEYQKEPGFTAYTLRSIDFDRFVETTGVRMTTNHYSESVVRNKTECWRQCSQHDQCVAVVYSDEASICYFYDLDYRYEPSNRTNGLTLCTSLTPKINDYKIDRNVCLDEPLPDERKFTSTNGITEQQCFGECRSNRNCTAAKYISHLSNCVTFFVDIEHLTPYRIADICSTYAHASFFTKIL